MNKSFFAIILFFSLFVGNARSKTAEVTQQISALLRQHQLEGGVFMKALHSGAAIKILENKMFPMASVFKLPIGLAVFHQVELGRIELAKKVVVTEKDIVGGVRGPIARAYSGKDLVYSVAELLKMMISESDNTACDLLMRLAGGPAGITKVIRKWGIEGLNVSRYESQILTEGSVPGVKGLDAATPHGLAQLYEKLSDGSILRPASRELLINLMISANTPPHIRRGIPEGYVIANKSGWCGELCVNDTALITNTRTQKKYIVVVMLYGKNNYQESSNLIAKITELGMNELVKGDQ